MKKNFGLMMILLLFSFLFLLFWPVSASHDQPKEFTLLAQAFQYSPFGGENIRGGHPEWGRVEVQQGDHLIIHLKSDDTAHGLHIDGYSIDSRVEPRQEVDVHFTADKPGKYNFRCSVTCGPLHPFMIGELVVEPNIPYRAGIALTFVTAVGALAFVWRKDPV